MASDGELCCESAWKNNNGMNLGTATADSWMRWNFLCGEDFQGDDYHRPSKQYPGHGQNFLVLPGRGEPEFECNQNCFTSFEAVSIHRHKHQAFLSCRRWVLSFFEPMENSQILFTGWLSCSVSRNSGRVLYHVPNSVKTSSLSPVISVAQDQRGPPQLQHTVVSTRLWFFGQRTQKVTRVAEGVHLVPGNINEWVDAFGDIADNLARKVQTSTPNCI